MLDKLIAAYPQFQFVHSSTPHWNAAEHIIYYDDNPALTLHELGHALLDHKKYAQDVQLVEMERAAWDVAQKLAPQYGVNIEQDFVEAALDSYRDWLHRRSLCPVCGQTGIQSARDLAYTCPNCHHRWRCNPAKKCRLKRMKI